MFNKKIKISIIKAYFYNFNLRKLDRSSILEFPVGWNFVKESWFLTEKLTFKDCARMVKYIVICQLIWTYRQQINLINLSKLRKQNDQTQRLTNH